jgi:hypothetical protein
MTPAAVDPAAHALNQSKLPSVGCTEAIIVSL